MDYMRIFVVFFLLLGFTFSGCTTLAPIFDSSYLADQVARENGFAKLLLPTGHFTLTTYHKLKRSGGPMVVYIEGDGLAYHSRTRISSDPTPRHPLILKLAALDEASNIVYLARPCQFTPHEEDPLCSPDYWTVKRFSEEVIVSMNEAINYFAEKSGAEEVALIGYSGGAAVAVLMAERRSDIQSIRTLAGNLDPVSLNRFHKVDPLDGSLNPMRAASSLAGIPQLHFWGTRDKIVPGFIAENFTRSIQDEQCIRIVQVPGVSHRDGWEDEWPRLLNYSFPC